MGFWDSLSDAVSSAVEAVVDVIVSVVGAIIDLLTSASEAADECFGTNAVGDPVEVCPYSEAPPQVAGLGVTVQQEPGGTPIKEALVKIEGPQTLEERTSERGVVTFENIRAGDYRIEAVKEGFKSGIATATIPPDTTAQATVQLGVRVLTLDQVDAQFAPGTENLDIKYKIRNMEAETVHLEITSDSDPSKPLLRRELTATEKAAGDAKQITWDGRCAATSPPALSGKLADPAHSPYKVALVGAGLRDEKPTKVEIHSLELEVGNSADNKLFMNNPADKFETVAKVSLKNKAGAKVGSAVEIKVRYTFSDPAPANRAANQSFIYTGTSTLGKRGDAAAIHWEDHAACTSTSTDGYKTQCDVVTLTAAGAEQGKAKIHFKPSGVGGDDFKIKTEIFASNGTTVLKSKESATLVVYRKVVFPAYEMRGQSHITTHGTNAKIRRYYRNTFVQYNLGTITKLSAKYSVKYVGLWDRAADAQKNWTTWQAKIPTEIPTATETTAANGAAGAARTTARNKIQTKANAWRDRIITQYGTALDNWAPDASVPRNSMVGARFEHPKYSANAPAADSTTSEWSGFAWLRISVEGRNMHPDRRWVNGLGVATRGRAYVFIGDTVAGTKETVAHEAGHESKNQFKRKNFGPGDHSAAAGLMDPTGSRPNFTAGEKNIFRGYR